jgi:glycosyltransferase involved in cell wall biosynthesis
MSVTLCIPTISPRFTMLERAVRSVERQILELDATIVVEDKEHEGAALTRDKALAEVDTDFVAFLDDDDELGPQHLKLLVDAQQITNADLVYPWFTVVGGTDPFPEHFGKPWDDARPHQTTVTFLARTSMIRNVGGFSLREDFAEPFDAGGNRAGEDYRTVLRLVKSGAKIVHLPVRTWLWHHHTHNTQGMPDRW